MAKNSYQSRVKNQIAQYATSKIHIRSAIYHYWSNTYLRPKLNSVANVDTATSFYVDHIRQRMAAMSSPKVRLLSLGVGDAELEIEVVQALLAQGVAGFQLECLELSPILIDRASQRIQELGLARHIRMVPCDLNAWRLPDSLQASYAAVLANHILHHVVELEAVFGQVARAIGEHGVFLTADMIGRNGHMRWPEALAILNPLWETLPEALKYNHVFQSTDRVFNNWDCSSEGFEGIRAQDILPLLVQRFHFETFLAFGNLTDPFCDRFYGPNFDPDIPAHRGFIDSLEALNAQLLELGFLKPTMMFAVISGRAQGTTRVWRNLTPRFCVRDPETLDLPRRTSQSLEGAYKPAILGFGDGYPGRAWLRSGWSQGEEWGVWMIADEATIEIRVPAGTQERLHLKMSAMAFVPQRYYARWFSFTADGKEIGDIAFKRSDKDTKIIELELDRPQGDSFLLGVIAHERASPSEEGSPDERLLGLALIDLCVY